MPIVVDKKKKAQDIGQAALKVFRSLGYHETRMADIAEAAGVGKGTLYEYFDDKADILQHVFEQYFDSFKEGALKAVADTNGAAAQLMALIDFSINHVAAWEDHCSVFVDYFGASRVGQEGSFSLSDIYSDIHKLIKSLVEQGQTEGEIRGDLDPNATAELLVSVFDGVVLHGVITERECDMGSLRDVARSLISKGLHVSNAPDSKTRGNKKVAER